MASRKAAQPQGWSRLKEARSSPGNWLDPPGKPRSLPAPQAPLPLEKGRRLRITQMTLARADPRGAAAARLRQKEDGAVSLCVPPPPTWSRGSPVTALRPMPRSIPRLHLQGPSHPDVPKRSLSPPASQPPPPEKGHNRATTFPPRTPREQRGLRGAGRAGLFFLGERADGLSLKAAPPEHAQPYQPASGGQSSSSQSTNRAEAAAKFHPCSCFTLGRRNRHVTGQQRS